MQPVPPHGNVLVFSSDRESGERLCRWIAGVGEEPVLLSGPERFLVERGDDETVDLVVTDLDTDDPSARGLFDRLLSGELFARLPQIHVLRDLAVRQELERRDPALSTVSILNPPEAGEFQSRVRLSAEIGRLRRELTRSAVRDPLTGLYNRRHLFHRLEEEFSRSRRYRNPLSFVLFDIDHLKNINDALGQNSGDSVIHRLAEVLRHQVRREDILGRTGEESFGTILPGNRYRGAAVFASKVRTHAEEILLRHEGSSFQVRVSAGISSYPDNRSIHDAEDLVRATENALAEAKTRGGNRVFIDEAVLRHERRVILVADTDRTLLDLAEDLLAMDDYRVLRADSSRTVIEALRYRRPDLLVLDLGMADEEGGVPLIEKIQDLLPGSRIPIIGLSSDPGADPERLIPQGVDRFITKPFSLSLLRSVARELLDAYRQG
jgi:diguanylate cyclase (GGDEF)-like protein